MSLYTSNGSGIIGSGEHEEVRAGGRAVLRAAREVAGRMEAVEAPALPEPGRAGLHVVVDSGVRSLETGEDRLASAKHPASELYFAGQDLITLIRDHDDRT